MSRRSALIFTIALSLLTTLLASDARAQRVPMTVTILRRTAVHTAPNSNAPTIANLNPTTFEVKKFELTSGFVRLLLNQIDPRQRSSGYGYIDTVDVAIDSGTTRTTATTATPTARPQAPVAVVKDTTKATRTDARAEARPEAKKETRIETPPRPITHNAGELVIRPDAPPPPLNPVDSPDLRFLKQAPLTAILQRPLSYQIPNTHDTITVPAGFVTDFSSIPHALWSSLSPLGEHQKAAIIHDYLYWFQPCEREETDNLLMLAMLNEGINDLQRGAVYAAVRIEGAETWNTNRDARDRGDLKIAPTQVTPTPQESWTDYRTRLAKADIRGTPGRMPRQKYCDYGKSQQLP